MPSSLTRKAISFFLAIALLSFQHSSYADNSASTENTVQTVETKPYKGVVDELSTLPEVVGQEEMPDSLNGWAPLSISQQSSDDSDPALIEGMEYDTLVYRDIEGKIIRIDRRYKDENNTTTRTEIYTEIAVHKKSGKEPSEDHIVLQQQSSLITWGRLDEVRFTIINPGIDGARSIKSYYNKSFITEVFWSGNGELIKIERHYKSGKIETYGDFRKHAFDVPLSKDYVDLFVYWQESIATVLVAGRLKGIRWAAP